MKSKHKYEQLDLELFPGFFDSNLTPPDEAVFEGDEYKRYEIDRSEEIIDIWNQGIRYAGLTHIVSDMKLDCVWRPREYNFMTDKLECKCKLDKRKLYMFINGHKDDFQTYLYDTWKDRKGFASSVPYRRYEWNKFMHYHAHSHIMLDYLILKYAIPAYEEHDICCYNDRLLFNTEDYPFNYAEEEANV